MRLRAHRAVAGCRKILGGLARLQSRSPSSPSSRANAHEQQQQQQQQLALRQRLKHGSMGHVSKLGSWRVARGQSPELIARHASAWGGAHQVAPGCASRRHRSRCPGVPAASQSRWRSGAVRGAAESTRKVSRQGHTYEQRAVSAVRRTRSEARTHQRLTRRSGWRQQHPRARAAVVWSHRGERRGAVRRRRRVSTHTDSAEKYDRTCAAIRIDARVNERMDGGWPAARARARPRAAAVSWAGEGGTDRRVGLMNSSVSSPQN